MKTSCMTRQDWLDKAEEYKRRAVEFEAKGDYVNAAYCLRKATECIRQASNSGN